MKFSKVYFIKRGGDEKIGDSPQFFQKGGDARGRIIKSKIAKEKMKRSVR